jgi:tRNA (guanosine-2'-O-)-methyltransferase
MTPQRTEKLINVLSKRQSNLTVVMENVQDPHNISAVLRTCDAVGIQDVYILTTKIPRHKKFGYKSSSSALKWLTIHEYDDLASCVSALRKNFTKILTTHLSSDAVKLYDIDFTESVALVFGNEHAGVTEEFRALADGNFIIPQMGIIQSLNISVACAVSIYEAMRQKMVEGHYDHASLSKVQMDTLLTQWGVEELTPETYVPYKPKRK